ncbi:AAA family ATPase [Bradyrhizobium sp. C-145]|uniref:AAA family ATPase n=1 Tax=Bradyrhizobium sp. C-145 TaxID=574727 RepID=UPI00201B5342|nr:AAA family ATPase [Bradyrhizobium sp. C-145]UQR67351.1 AAA family ATPase [Bradyrhizobium sp. C-145]
MTTISGDRYGNRRSSNGAWRPNEQEAAQADQPHARKAYYDADLTAQGYAIVETYEYTDLNGHPIYFSRRYERRSVRSKAFRQGHYDAAAENEYADAGLDKVPYRWPHLVAADRAETVFWCEGEKDADTLTRLGLVATTAAGQVLSAIIAKAVTDRHVVVLVDNDDKGEENAANAVNAFRHYAASLRVLRLPDLPRTEDVTYWFNNGGTVEALLRLVDEEPCLIAEERRGAIRASRFALCGDDEIPWPDYVYGNSYIRGTLSVTASAGGLGKSALLLTEALAMATGRKLLHPTPQTPLRVWYINLEDGDNVLVPRLKAAAKFHGIANADVGDRLFVDNSNMKLVLASEDERRRASLNQAAITRIIREIKANRFDVVMIDPLVSAHQISENDNSAVDLVAKALARIARETNCSLMVSHHMTKGQEARTADNVRGASALVNAARVVRVLNAMTAEEAERANVDAERRGFYFRMDDGKTNLAPAESSTWFERVNYDEFSFDDARKNVVVLKPFAFTAPEAAARLGNMTQMEVAAAFAEGGPWRFDRQARSGWAGEQLAMALGIGAETKAEKDLLQRALRSFVQRGWLSVFRAPDAQRKPREWVRMANGAPPSEGDARNEGGANC